METAPTIIAMSGSLREGSFNRKLLRIAVEMAESAGAEVTTVDLREYPLPIYDADFQAAHGFPEAVKKLKAMFARADGFLFACPEYNSSVTAVWKNTIDWISRRDPPEPAFVALAGKVAGLMSAAPGKLGGIRGLFHVRDILTETKTIVLPQQVAVPEAAKAFTDDGLALLDDARSSALKAMIERLVTVCRQLT